MGEKENPIDSYRIYFWSARSVDGARVTRRPLSLVNFSNSYFEKVPKILGFPTDPMPVGNCGEKEFLDSREASCSPCHQHETLANPMPRISPNWSIQFRPKGATSCWQIGRVKMKAAKCRLHPLIHTSLEFAQAQDLEKKKAEPRTPHFFSLNQDIVAWS